MSLLPHIEIDPKSPADASIIWLHGLGADGHDFEPIVPELGLPTDAAVRFIFPHAPAIPVTINAGYVMPAWYDILDISIDRKVDVAQLMNSADAIRKLIDREVERGVESTRIVVAGFSQGGAVAIQTALTYPRQLAGLLGLSTYFATAESIQPHPVNAGLPVKICHGSADPMVPEFIGRKGVEKLRELGYNTEYQTYPIEHSVCMEEIADIAVWLRRVLSLA
ncbi:MAG: dienelactone hydrolase family protein [Chromatiaceae bacterium]|nr:dienelactone hydrolase family protein [Gammaproteobacteria bacterium]MCB1880056.1 dienelactone hydrolase family protein [Gammaproteobacteria bacterium]MCP5445575.1 dienelactone hydrolase family protein [Chromatiaceae bacterium]